MYSGIAGLLPEFGLVGLSGICATIQAMFDVQRIVAPAQKIELSSLIQAPQLNTLLRKGNKFVFKRIETLAFSRLQRSPEL
jgi:hypothetical protein